MTASMISLRNRLFIALAAMVVAVFAFLVYGQYQASVTSRKEAALRSELFKARDAIDAQKADAARRPVPLGQRDKGTAR